ncbi:hypothetical protein [Candidatus Electrothrix sp.]|uniref:hypothetical protein n=1 Tax=Candidatus Electrothrix sp. TaxID=2170559 RepID=UPI00405666D9
MNTLPAMTFEDHIDRLIDFVTQRDSSINNFELRFYYLQDLKSKGGQLYIEKDLLFTIKKFKNIFIGLCTEGTEWINISAVCQFSDNIYGIEYDYSEKKKREKTSINISGPNTDIKGKLKGLNVRIV